MWDSTRTWLAAHTLWVGILGGATLLLSVGALVLTPFVLARLPADFFLRLTAPPVPGRPRPHPARVAGRNLLGAMLVLLGVLLVPLPGPGALVALLGLALADFPGKRRLLAAALRLPTVLRTINWLRRRANRAAMLPPNPGDKRPVATAGQVSVPTL